MARRGPVREHGRGGRERDVDREGLAAPALGVLGRDPDEARVDVRPVLDAQALLGLVADRAERGLEVKTIRPNLLSVVCNGRFTGILAVLYHSLT